MLFKGWWGQRFGIGMKGKCIELLKILIALLDFMQVINNLELQPNNQLDAISFLIW